MITLKDTGLQSTYAKEISATFPIEFGKWVTVAYFRHQGYGGGFPPYYYLRDEYSVLKKISREEFKIFLLNYLNQL